MSLAAARTLPESTKPRLRRPKPAASVGRREGLSRQPPLVGLDETGERLAVTAPGR